MPARALPPGPPGSLPIVGHFPLMGLGALDVPNVPPPHVIMGALSKIYGDVMSMRFGNYDVAILSSPQAVEEALCQGDCKAGAGRPSLPSVLSNGLSQGLSSSKCGQDWQVIRNILLQEAFSRPAVLKSSEGIVAEEAARFAASMQPIAESGEAVKMRPLLRHAVTQLLFRWALTLEPDSPQAAELEQLVEKAWQILTDPLVTASDFMGVRGPETVGDLLQIRRQRTALLSELVVARRREVVRNNFVGDRKIDFLDALLRAQERHGFGVDLIVETLVSLTTAGISTVATSLEWLVLLLALNPEVQARARMDALGQGEDRFLDACILETLRLKTPLFVPRRCLQSIDVRGWNLQKDTLLLPDSYALAHDPALWKSNDLDQFKPERFLNEEKHLLDHLPGVKPKCPFSNLFGKNQGVQNEAFKFLPFGTGARFCPGAPLALKELRGISSALLCAYEWESPDGGDLTEAYSFTLTPKYESPIVFHLRDKNNRPA